MPRHRRLLAGVVLLAGYAVMTGWLLQSSYDVAGGVLVAHLLAVPTVPLVVLATRREADPWIRKLLAVAIVAKLLGTFLRFAVQYTIFGGKGDALRYDRVGKELAKTGFADVGELVGTRFIEVATGLLYRVIGPTTLGGFLVYSWLGFLGLYLFYRSFSVAFPEGDRRRYAVLAFFLPSLLFWPSSIGKDAWMTLALGLIAYGAAGLWASERRFVSGLSLLLGVVATLMVRPHITVTAMVSLTVAYLMSRSRRSSMSAPLSRMAGAVALLLVLAFVVASFRNFFQLDAVNSQSVDVVLEKATTRSSDAGSEFDPVAARSPLQLPLAVFSVLFRPLPFEAHNPQSMVASLEGTVLLVLFVRSGRRLWNLIPSRRSAYLSFVAAYSGLFVIGFSNFANFGILARQRVQLFPFILMALCVPSKASATADRSSTATSAGQRATGALVGPRQEVAA